MNKKDCQTKCSSQVVQHMVKFNKQNLPTHFAAVETVVKRRNARNWLSKHST